MIPTCLLIKNLLEQQDAQTSRAFSLIDQLLAMIEDTTENGEIK